METILVIGATGMLGVPVAKKLKSSFTVRLLVRDMAKAKALFGDVYEYVEGDIFNAESLEKALTNCQGVHINLSGEIEQIGTERIVAAAKDKKIRRITYISGTSVDKETIWFPMEKRKYFAEQAVVSSGITYTIFRPTWFMEVLPRFVRGDRAVVLGKQPNLYHFIAAEDYARMVSVAYQKKEAENKCFFIHGNKGYLFQEALEMYIRENHPSIQSVKSMPYFVARIIASLSGNKALKEVAELMQFFEKVGEKGNPEGANSILGAPEISLEEWIKGQGREQSGQ